MPLPLVPLAAFVLPLLVGFGATGLLRHWGGRCHGPRLAELGLSLGFIAAFIGLSGGVPFNGLTAHHGIGEVAVAAAALGAIAIWLPVRHAVLMALGILGGGFAIAWPLGLLHPARLPLDDLIAAGIAGIGAIAIMLRLIILGRSGAAPVIVLTVAALALAVIALLARQNGLGHLALALAAACAGFLVWTSPFARWRFGPAALLGGGMIFVTLALAVSRGGLRAPWPLVLLAVAFWGDHIAVNLPVLAGLARKKPFRPIVFGVGALLPAGAAAGLAWLLS